MVNGGKKKTAAKRAEVCNEKVGHRSVLEDKAYEGGLFFIDLQGRVAKSSRSLVIRQTKNHPFCSLMNLMSTTARLRWGMLHGTAGRSKGEAMKEITLGRTGLRVKQLGFGGLPLMRVNEEQAVETVRYAVEKGIDFIETARVYPTSERRVGMALKQIDKPVVLASKSKDRTADGIRSDLELSLEKLQKDYIDLYQCHWIKDDEYAKIISPGGALEGLYHAKEQGLIGHIGITSHSLDILDRVVDDALFDTIMVCLSFLEPSAREKVIPKAAEKNIGVIAMKPLSGGVIDHPKPALKWTLSHENLLVLCGMETKERFDENWQIFTGSHQLDEEDNRVIEKIRRQYDLNFCRRCDYCQPCTEGINIQMVLGVRSQVKRMGPAILTREPRTSLLEKARSCSECEECMSRCPYSLPIPELIKKNLNWVESMLKAMHKQDKLN